MRFVERLVAIIAPHSCLGCRAEGVLLCRACAAALPAVPSRCYRCSRVTKEYRTCPACRRQSDIFAAYPCTIYDGTAKELVHSLKYERARAAAADIACAIASQGWIGDGFIISHVPTANTRVRLRGYDQAELIARRLAVLTGVPYASLLLRRTEERQVGQKRATRQLQMRDAFRPAAYMPAHKHVLLIDDVLTTGATCEAAAHTLKQAGIKRVSVAVFAAA